MSAKKTELSKKFKIIRCIKQNDYQAVYLADHVYLGKKIFLKTLNTKSISDDLLIKRFQREAKILAQLDHPNIIKVYDFGIDDEQLYISFEYFESTNLRDFLKQSPPDNDTITHIVVQIFKGLQSAHAKQVVHRDLKPENILINSNLEVKIADFGLAIIKSDSSLTASTSIVGTPAYMAPEQIRGETCSPSSDLFSVGIIFYELYTRRNPFIGRDAGQTLNNILSFDIKTLEDQLKALPEKSVLVINRLLAKNKSARFQNAREVLIDLDIHDSSANETQLLVDSRGIQKKVLAALGIFIVVSIFATYFIYQEFYFSPAQPLANIESQQNNTDTPAMETSNDSIIDRTSKTDKPAVESVVLDPIVRSNQTLEQLTGTEQSLSGSLMIESNPWTYVWIDSAKIDSTPLTSVINLNPGSYFLQLQHPKYPLYETKLDILPGQTSLVKVNLDTLVGYLSCRIHPWGSLYLSGALVGESPIPGVLMFPPGQYEMEIRNPNFSRFRESIEIKKNDTLEFKYNFELKQLTFGDL